MKNRSILKLSILLVVFTLAFSACVKETDEPEDETVNPVPAAKFSWKINSGTSVSADESFFITAYNNIVGKKSNGSYVDITLDGLGKGTYNVSPSSGIILEYSSGSNTFTGQSGTVVILENTGTLISGTFNCSFGGGGTTSTIQGQFSNVPKK